MKGVFSLLCIFTIYMIVFHPKAKKIREIEVKRQSKEIDSHKWNLTNLQKKIQDESKRQYKWY